MSFHGIAVPPKIKIAPHDCGAIKTGCCRTRFGKKNGGQSATCPPNESASSLCREFADSRKHSITNYNNLVKDFIEFFLLSSFFAK